MAVVLTEEMLSEMANTLQYLQSRLDETYNFGVSLEEKFDIDLVSNASGIDQDMDGWRNLLQLKLFKLTSIHKVWSTKSCKADVELFNGLCVKISDQIAVKMNECLVIQRYCLTKALFAPSVAAVEASAAADPNRTLRQLCSCPKDRHPLRTV